MLGNALGSRTLRKACQRVPPMERINSRLSGRTALSPVSVSMTIGKNEIRKVISTFGRSPKPNHTMNSGASATLGRTCAVSRMG